MTIMALIFQRLLAASKWLVEEINGYQWHTKHPAIPRQINTLKPLLLLLPSALEFEGFSKWVCLKSEYISFQYPVSKDSDTPISVSRIGRTFFTVGPWLDPGMLWDDSDSKVTPDISRLGSDSRKTLGKPHSISASSSPSRMAIFFHMEVS